MRLHSNASMDAKPQDHNLKAIKTGTLTATGGQLRVHSVYRCGINLQRPGTRVLVSLVGDARDMAPTAMLLDRLPERLSVGAGCRLDQSLLIIAERWRIACRGAERWEGRLTTGVDYRLSAERLAALRSLVIGHGRPGGMLGIVHPPARNPFSEFARRLLAAALDRRVAAHGAVNELIDLSALVGLGVGLTPSGDDFLTGAMLAQELCTHSGRSRGQLNLPAICGRLHATTAAGETLLAASVQRRFPAYLIDLCDRLFGVAPDARLAVDQRPRLLDHGQTSGTDAAVGLLWFFSNFIKKP